MRRFLTAVVPALVGLAFAATVSQAADLTYEEAKAVYDSLPSCHDAEVLYQVEEQFEYGAPTVLEQKLEILEFSGMFEKADFPQRFAEPLPPPQPIARRYCQAQALISDHQRRTVYYVIEYPMGFAAAGAYLGRFSPVKGWRAEGCVLGLDPWKIYGANCQSLRRFPAEGRTGLGFVTK